MAPLSTSDPLALGTQMPSSPYSVRTRAAVVGASALALIGIVGLVAIRSEVLSSLRGTDVNVGLSSMTAEKRCSWVSEWQQEDTSACLAIPDAELVGGGHGQVFRVPVPDGDIDYQRVCRPFGIPVAALNWQVSGAANLAHFNNYDNAPRIAEQLGGGSTMDGDPTYAGLCMANPGFGGNCCWNSAGGYCVPQPMEPTWTLCVRPS